MNNNKPAVSLHCLNPLVESKVLSNPCLYCIKKPFIDMMKGFKEEGGDILSHNTAVPSALTGLTT
ncbi:hypothetical protein ACNI3T_15030, partial [Christiangramia sp. ASW11-125]|uniref:hypothetical protein n=1 Tax=Christiangramia sp. ASW11-125 TaxID=3400701 RepID=UPI003AAC17F5